MSEQPPGVVPLRPLHPLPTPLEAARAIFAEALCHCRFLDPERSADEPCTSCREEAEQVLGWLADEGFAVVRVLP